MSGDVDAKPDEKSDAKPDEPTKAAAKRPDGAKDPPKRGKLRTWLASVRERWDEHVREYGAIAILVYLAIWLSVWAGFAIAISMGFDVGGDVSGAGMTAIIGAAYIPTKVSQPIRIAATLVVTPVVANVWHRIRGRDPKVRIGRAAMMRSSKDDTKDDAKDDPKAVAAGESGDSEGDESADADAADADPDDSGVGKKAAD